MALPRPIVLLVALGAVLMAATFYAVRGAREQSQSGQISQALPAVQPKPVVPVARPKAKTGPQSAAKHKAQARAHEAPAKRAAAAKPAKPQPARPAKRKDPGASLGLPASVARAIGRHKTVVVLFYRPGAADDDATARAVASVRSKRVSVFHVRPKHFGDYRRLVSGLDLTSLPATVIVGRNRSARVVEGFVDGRTLAQEVADSAR